MQRGELIFRLPNPDDLDAFYAMRNDAEALRPLGGYSPGMSRKAAAEWLAARATPSRDLIFMMLHQGSGDVIGHVGLYQLDHRVRSGEFAILIGNRGYWGRGLGETATRFMVEYGFAQLNLHRIQLEVLTSNARAIGLYVKVGFQHEGTRRAVQFKDGQYHDYHMMSLLEGEYRGFNEG